MVGPLRPPTRMRPSGRNRGRAVPVWASMGPGTGSRVVASNTSTGPLPPTTRRVPSADHAASASDACPTVVVVPVSWSITAAPDEVVATDDPVADRAVAG